MNNTTVMKTTSIVLLLLTFVSITVAQDSDRQRFIRVEAPVVALLHVRVVDGTGAAPMED